MSSTTLCHLFGSDVIEPRQTQLDVAWSAPVGLDHGARPAPDNLAAAAHAASQRAASEPAAPLATAACEGRRGPAATVGGFQHRAAPRPVSHTGPDRPARRP